MEFPPEDYQISIFREQVDAKQAGEVIRTVVALARYRQPSICTLYLCKHIKTRH